jgi:hypothetical protein
MALKLRGTDWGESAMAQEFVCFGWGMDIDYLQMDD